jgi:hypothetical protein
MEACIASEDMALAEGVWTKKGFWRDLEPMAGALQALLEMESEGYRVFLVTTALPNAHFCAQVN